jgi:hypothetical protein
MSVDRRSEPASFAPACSICARLVNVRVFRSLIAAVMIGFGCGDVRSTPDSGSSAKDTGDDPSGPDLTDAGAEVADARSNDDSSSISDSGTEDASDPDAGDLPTVPETTWSVALPAVASSYFDVRASGSGVYSLQSDSQVFPDGSGSRLEKRNLIDGGPLWAQDFNEAVRISTIEDDVLVAREQSLSRLRGESGAEIWGVNTWTPPLLRPTLRGADR